MGSTTSKVETETVTVEKSVEDKISEILAELAEITREHHKYVEVLCGRPITSPAEVAAVATEMKRIARNALDNGDGKLLRDLIVYDNMNRHLTKLEGDISLLKIRLELLNEEKTPVLPHAPVSCAFSVN